jgi:hypothetical protein
VQGEGEVAVMGQAVQRFWLIVLRTQMVSQAGWILKALLAIGTVIVLVAVMFLEILVIVK